MNNIEKTLKKIDRKIDKKFGFAKSFLKKYFPVISTFFFVFLVFIFVVRVFYSRPGIIASIIEDDVKLVTLALEKIDAKCSILSIKGDYAEIDFLNTKKFAGSQVGPLNLAFPDKWEGPYLRVNPTLQEKFYEIVRAKDGFFVMPGRGVSLPNGLIVGKDFKVTSEIEVGALLRDGGPLRYKERFFATKLLFKVGDWETWHFKEDTVQDLNRMLKEFNEAMPFTHNSQGTSYST